MRWRFTHAAARRPDRHARVRDRRCARRCRRLATWRQRAQPVDCRADRMGAPRPWSKRDGASRSVEVRTGDHVMEARVPVPLSALPPAPWSITGGAGLHDPLTEGQYWFRPAHAGDAGDTRQPRRLRRRGVEPAVRARPAVDVRRTTAGRHVSARRRHPGPPARRPRPVAVRWLEAHGERDRAHHPHVREPPRLRRRHRPRQRRLPRRGSGRRSGGWGTRARTARWFTTSAGSSRTRCTCRRRSRTHRARPRRSSCTCTGSTDCRTSRSDPCSD